MVMKPFFLSNAFILANKGGIPDLPPCSIQAYERALELGADVLTVPVHLTADNKLIVSPGNDLENYTNLAGKPIQYSLTELERADAAHGFDPALDRSYPWRGKDVTLMSLEELLSRFPDTRFSIELMDKTASCALEFCAIVEKMKAEGRILAGSPHGANIKIVRENLPVMATSFTPLGVVGFYALFRSGLLYFKKKFKSDALLIPEAIGPSYMANRILIREAKKRGLHVFIWNAETVEEVERLMTFGVNGFVADDVEKTSTLIKEAKVLVENNEK
jgi:glycerophosphoryl diester phosphodiesterase